MRQRGRSLARTVLLTAIGTVFGLSMTMCLQAIRTLSLKSAHSCGHSKAGNHDNSETEIVAGNQPELYASRPLDQPVTLLPDVQRSNYGRPARDLLFVGVMTAQKYVDTRGYGIYTTWAQNLIANGSFALFTSSVTQSGLSGVQMPLIRLTNVDDSYPPQKKSFTMFKYFYENYLDRYEWFVRADDDVYIRLDKLEVFLRSLNSSEPLFIGQAGLGTPEEFGQLSLREGENYCMGGPGMIMSRETLRRLGPHIDECLAEMITTHEDVEVGRCVNRFAGITCTWAYEMRSLFYNNHSGTTAYTGDLNVPEVHHAMTLHPVKREVTMRRLHSYIRGLKLADLGFRSLQLSRDVLMSLRELESEGVVVSEKELSKVSDYALPPSLTKFVPSNVDDVLAWEFLSPNIAFCYGAPNCPRHNIESYWRYSIANIIRQVMDIVNKYSRQRGRVLEYQEILYGYRRVDPFHGADYVFDLLLLYKKFKGRRLTIPVRRHAYLQQSFGRLRMIEEDSLRRLEERLIWKTVHDRQLSTTLEDRQDWRNVEERQFGDLENGAFGKDLENNKFGKDLEGGQDWRNEPGGSVGKTLDARLFINSNSTRSMDDEPVYIILPLSGRSSTFLRFVDLLEKTCLKNGELLKLYIILYSSSVNSTDDLMIRESIRRLQDVYSGSHEIRLFDLDGDFNRGAALSYGASQCPMDALLLFTDVDVVFSRDFLYRLRRNTVRGRRVYFPIVFSQYANTSKSFSSFTYPSRSSSLMDTSESIFDEISYRSEAGYFRHFGYGLLGVYRSDFESVGGFDLSIRGWGMEDVDVFDKFIKKSTLTIFRAPDPDLVHVYHPITCDAHLPFDQLEMCRGSKAESLASVHTLSDAFYDPDKFSSLFNPDNATNLTQIILNLTRFL